MVSLMGEVMTDESNAPTIEPITASADGKRNAYTHSCHFVQQKMNYAACLSRVAAIDGGKYPKDWEPCSSATNSCPARRMRREEEIAGKAIYFAPRGTIATAAATAGRWISDKVKKAVAPPAPRAKSSMFDAMRDAGSMADVINAMSTTHTSAAAPAPAPMKPLPVAQPGETPLQMARRLAAAKKAAQ